MEEMNSKIKIGLILEALFLGAYVIQGGIDMLYSTNDILESITMLAGFSPF